MSNEFVAGQLDVLSFARGGAVLAGQDLVSGFPRLAQEAGASIDGRKVDWNAKGEVREGVAGAVQNWLHLEARVVFPMVCQRCLGPADVTVTISRSFRFVATEAQAEAEDDVADEDVLVLDRRFDLFGLIEDEFLMSLPAIPRHETCPTEVKLVVQDSDFEHSPDGQTNPFAVLAKLQTGKTS